MYFIETNVWYINIWPAKRCLLRRSWLVGPWPLPPDRKFPGHRQNQESKQDAARPALSIIPTDGRSRSVGSDPRYIFSDPLTCLALYCDRLHSPRPAIHGPTRCWGRMVLPPTTSMRQRYEKMTLPSGRPHRVRSACQKLGPIRNKIMHCRRITSEYQCRLRSFSKSWLVNVIQFTFVKNVVQWKPPKPTCDHWRHKTRKHFIQAWPEAYV